MSISYVIPRALRWFICPLHVPRQAHQPRKVRNQYARSCFTNNVGTMSELSLSTLPVANCILAEATVLITHNVIWTPTSQSNDSAIHGIISRRCARHRASARTSAFAIIHKVIGIIRYHRTTIEAISDEGPPRSHWLKLSVIWRIKLSKLAYPSFGLFTIGLRRSTDIKA